MPRETHARNARTYRRSCGEIEQLRLMVRSKPDSDAAVCTREPAQYALRAVGETLIWKDVERLVKTRGKLAHYPYAGQATLGGRNASQPGFFVAHFTICRPSLATRGSPFQACP